MITLQLGIIFILVTEFVLGEFANVFIVVVNCIDWVKRKKLSPTDWILSALALSRIALLCILLIYWYSAVADPALYNGQVKSSILTAWAITNHVSIWLTTILSIFYLLKIVNFSNIVFFHLKKNINSVILVVFFGSFVVLFCYLAVLNVELSILMTTYEQNMTCKSNWVGILHLTNVTLFIITNVVPFTISLACVLMLIYSLYKHLRKMQVHGNGSQDPSTKIHVKAMQTVISFLVLFSIYFLSVIVSIWILTVSLNVSSILLFYAIEVIYPSAHSFVLIWGNRKLKQAFLLMLWQVQCWLK
ncbi:taste receptor type 2 member 20-like [Ochotona curzoniae]|uniref:taste receptor type 2 member 20-like n=1 Tax=Ochotona curzoniae TaxID=130825 RepID=UPI001B352F5E|nr:taste receptor type 2 member 20-like [Ochotona curzoniae]